MRRVAFLAVAAALIGVIALSPPALARKRRPANNEVCFNKALSDSDRSDCKKQIADATTAEDRNRIRKVFQQKVYDAAKATAADAAKAITAPHTP